MLRQKIEAHERFWRGDAARSGEDHCGLGLALARRAAELIDASIRASAADGWFEVSVIIASRKRGQATFSPKK